MIRVCPELSIRRQCELLGVSRSGLYYEPVGTDPEELALMRRIDEIHLKWPFYGSRKVTETLRGSRTRARRLRKTLSTRTCCGTWKSTAQIKSGPPT